jgi:hypothetical protein
MSGSAKAARSVCSLFAAAAPVALAASAHAIVYTDPVGDRAGGDNTTDIVSVEVTNDASNVTFSITLNADISQAGVSDWANYHIGFDTGAGGSTTPAVGWGQVFGMSAGMDYWAGSWVNFGGGAELHQWDGNAGTWSATIPGSSVTLSQFGAAITVPLSALGLSVGSEFDFDVWSTFGAPGGQSAYDASSNPAVAVGEPWNGIPYDASTAGPGGTPLVSAYTVVPGPSTSQWTGAVDGNWSSAGNWSGAVPDGIGQIASFGSIATANYAVAVDGTPRVLGTMSFDSATSYTIGSTGGNGITLQVSSGQATINVDSGVHTVAAPLTLASDTTVAVASAGAGLNFTGNLVATGRTITKVGAGAARFEHIRAASLTANGGLVQISAKPTANDAAGTSVVQALTIAAGAQVDLTNNSMVIDYSGAVGTLVDDTRAALLDGRLDSSMGSSSTGLGYGDNAVLNRASHGGQTVDTSSVLIKFTYFGDADLNGQVDVADLGALASNWQTSAPWTSGDFDYSGFVDVADLGLLASNWQSGVGSPLGPSLAEALAAVGLPSSTVPEPGAIGLLFCGALSLKRRRRALHR